MNSNSSSKANITQNSALTNKTELTSNKSTTAMETSSRSLPRMFRGVTLENVEDRDYQSPDSSDGKKYAKEIAQIAATIRNNSKVDNPDKWITTRIVFDFDKDSPNAVNYKRLTELLHNPSSRSYVMGEFLDSKQLEECPLDCFQNRVDEYLSTLGKNVDIWEVGNEVNGEWAGKDIPEIIKKINIAAQKVKAQGGKTTLTLYYNKGCPSNDDEEVFNWISNHGKDIKADNIDYVLASYYEDECKNRRPDINEWKGFFKVLMEAFKHSTGEPIKVGFGEVGRRDNNAPKKEKLELIGHYYGTVHSALAGDTELKDRYVGGYFWWQYKYDMVFGSDKVEFNRKFDDVLSRW